MTNNSRKKGKFYFNTFAFFSIGDINSELFFISLLSCFSASLLLNGRVANGIFANIHLECFGHAIGRLECFSSHFIVFYFVQSHRHSSGVVYYSGMSLNGPAMVSE